MNILKYSVLFLTFVCITHTSISFAHGTGVSFEETKDGYKTDIGHDESITAKESTRFDFAVYPIDFANVTSDIYTDVWVTITKNKKIYFAGGIHKPEFGTTGFTFVFPEKGEYLISARFQKNGETVTKSEFPFTVIAPLEVVEVSVPYALYGGILAGGIFVGMIGGVISSRKLFKKKMQHE